MTDEAIKKRLDRAVDYVENYFKVLGFRPYRLDGYPFHLEFVRYLETWKVRVVLDKETPQDTELLKREIQLNPAYFTKALAVRTATDIRIIEIK